MQVDEQTIEISSNWFSPERDVTRTKGLHLSHVINYIEYCEGKRSDVYGEMDSGGNAFAGGGFLWERVLAHLIEDTPWELWNWMFGRAMTEPENPHILRPGEFCLDAGPCPKCNGKGELPIERRCKPCKGSGRILVYGTPDGIHMDDGVLEEWKDTSKSAATPITDNKFRRWVSFQIPIYLKALGLTVCRLRVRFNRGDYKDIRHPIWKEFTLTYTQQEIDDTWEMVANHARLMYSEGLV